MAFLDRISVDPTIRFGKACVRGTRLTVGEVLGYLADGMSEAEVLSSFPQLTHEDVLACLAYAAERERRTLSIPCPREGLCGCCWMKTFPNPFSPQYSTCIPSQLHVRLLGAGGAPDDVVWRLAKEHDCVLVTRDEDFLRLSIVRGAPPKVVWLAVGNCSNPEVIRLLRTRHYNIQEFLRP